MRCFLTSGQGAAAPDQRFSILKNQLFKKEHSVGEVDLTEKVD